MPDIAITVDGHAALTVEQAAIRYGLTRSSMRAAITRLGDRIAPAADLDGHKKLYLTEQLDAAMQARPGRGGHLRGHR